MPDNKAGIGISFEVEGKTRDSQGTQHRVLSVRHLSSHSRTALRYNVGHTSDSYEFGPA